MHKPLHYSLILTGIREIFTASAQTPVLSGRDLCIAADVEGNVVFVGETEDLARREPGYESRYANVVVNVEGRAVWPGLVDSHTHLVYAGTREGEFALKSRGASYAEIAAAGGGILHSAEKTNAASFEELYEAARRRLLQVASYGVTTIEIKSGYALDTAGEIRLLEVVARLKEEFPLEIVPTFLGAHAYPARFKDNHEGYLVLLCDEMLPEVKRRGLAEFCDVFCEEGFFSVPETERILRRAADLGFGLKVHADQFTALGGTEMAAAMGAVSIDHLEVVKEEGITLMARHGVVAGVLPLTSLFSRLPYAPARKMHDAGVRVALATDFNPGSCMCGFLPLAATVAATQLSLPIEEALRGITIHGAASVRRDTRKGSIEIGKDADILVMDAPSWIYPIYHAAHNHVWRIFIRGRPFDPSAFTKGGRIG